MRRPVEEVIGHDRVIRQDNAIIATLRKLVGIRQEIELEDAEPEGNA